MRYLTSVCLFEIKTIIIMTRLLAGLGVGLAVMHNNEELIESLVMRGADVDGHDSDGMTALHMAAYLLQAGCVRRQVMASIQTSVNLVSVVFLSHANTVSRQLG